jgi:plastocyanin
LSGFNGGWSQVQGYLYQDLLGREITSEDELVTIGKGKYTDPKFVWVTTIGPTALKFLNSEKLGKEYANDMFTGDINNGLLYRFTLNEARDNILINDTSLGNVAALADNQVDETTENQPLIFGQGFGGITDIQVGPDGYLYVLSYTGALYRIVPISESTVPKNQQALADQSETQSAGAIPVVIAGLKGDQSYSPNPIRIESGQTITWYNGDSISHTVTSGQATDEDEGALFDSNAIIPNQSYSMTFDNSGEFKYYCIYHPSMVGDVIVE